MQNSKYIIMKSRGVLIASIYKPTKALFFKDLLVGDEIRFSIPVAASGYNVFGGGVYASYVTIENVVTGAKTSKSFNQLSIILKNFTLEEI